MQIIALTRIQEELAIDGHSFLLAFLEVPSPRNKLVKIIFNSRLNLLQVFQFIQDPGLIFDVRRCRSLRPLSY